MSELCFEADGGIISKMEYLVILGMAFVAIIVISVVAAIVLGYWWTKQHIRRSVGYDLDESY